jgi:hypothetical protein
VASITDPQAIWNSVAAHLQALFYVIQVHGHEVLAWLAPPVHAAISWIDSQLQAAIAWAGPAVRHVIDAAQPYGATALGFLVAYWHEVAIVTGPAIVIIALAVWMRRRRRVKATLFDVSLDRDPKTEWLKLDIVMRNFQSHALVVRSLCVEQPADVRICEHWKAWQPSAEGVRFIAPELALTNEAEIERTILPHGAHDHRASGLRGYVGGDSELTRSFYLRAPAGAPTRAIKLRAVLHCELQTRNGRKQDHSFQRMLEPVTAGNVSAVAT